MSALQVFAYEGSEVRTVLVDGEPWFVGADVTAILGYANGRDALSSIPDRMRNTVALADGKRGNPNRVIVSEPGVYRLVMRSSLPAAERFQDWLAEDVLPQIRKTGRFDAAPAPAPAKEITAAAGPVPYRDQAEILAILRPALPEPYATATAKVILARAMGERPELDSSETPLYAATFLAEKGHKAKTVAKFQSGFGARVSNAFFKRHGRRPEKIAGPAGSRIDKVAVYTEDDRPLLEEVYAGMADLIAAFEHGGQIALSA
ncbi:BRO-N domain-containing protein [Streptomyces racemochromogenes]|uniref:BRO-N domain-containing protein n=1 Tax=Streptomyces racemochromogenes TaxID=67353 RepID=UPI0031EC69BF